MNTETAEATAKATVKILNDTGVPREALGVAFGKVWDAVSGVPAPEQRQVGNRNDANRNGSTNVDESEPLGRIASRLGVAPEAIEQVFDYHSDDLHLSIHPSKLDATKSRATLEIALLLSAGRQALGLDDAGTPLNVVRVNAEHFKRYDSKNFSTTLNGLSKVMTVRGSGKDRLFKMTSPAWAEASELVKSLTDE